MSMTSFLTRLLTDCQAIIAVCKGPMWYVYLSYEHTEPKKADGQTALK